MSDFSTIISIVNASHLTLTDGSLDIVHGTAKTQPVSKILNFQYTKDNPIIVDDNTGIYGSEGTVKYNTVVDGNKYTFQMDFSDPFTGNNACSISNPNPSVFSVSFQARSAGGPWQNNKCPDSGHPLEIVFYIMAFADVIATYKNPSQNLITQLKKWYPNIDISSVKVLGEQSMKYNCIAWSFGIDYTWIDPPADLNTFKDMYAYAATLPVPLNGTPGVWRPYTSWDAVTAKAAEAEIDGWGWDDANMQHASRFVRHRLFPGGAWTSKHGGSYLTTHDRNGLRNPAHEEGSYGSILTSFVRKPADGELEAMRLHHLKVTRVGYVTTAEAARLRRMVKKIPDSLADEFRLRYQAWTDAITRELPFSSNTRDSAVLPEFGELIALGSDVLPLVVQMIVDDPGQNFFAVVVYDALQSEESLKVVYATQDDPYLFEGTPARAVRSAKLFLSRRP